MTRRFDSRFLVAAFSIAIPCAAIVACSAAAPSSGFGRGSRGDPSAGGGDDGAGSGSLGGSSGTLGNGGGGTTLGDAACAAATTKAEQLPLDMYVMLDQSLSMLDTGGGAQSKWDAVTQALTSFVQQPAAAGIGVGIQYFGQPDPTGAGEDSCDPSVYATPDVEIAPLPGAATAITQSISAHQPSSSTPTSAALQGAVNHASDWAKAHAGHVTVVVLATDGEPTECDPILADVDAIAAAGVAATPHVATYVIGVGSETANLNALAQAGGSGNAFIVDTGGNANQQFLDALNKIRGSALGCQFQIPIPSNGTPNYDQVNVELTPDPNSAPVVIPRVQDKAHCPSSGDAWYYDDDAHPTQILLCDTTCGKASGSATAVVNVLTGCQTVVK